MIGSILLGARLTAVKARPAANCARTQGCPRSSAIMPPLPILSPVMNCRTAMYFVGSVATGVRSAPSAHSPKLSCFMVLATSSARSSIRRGPYNSARASKG